MVVLGEIARNESARRKIDPTTLLLGADTPARYGPAGPHRFSATDIDPTVGHVLIASFVLAGQTGQFARGATAFLRPAVINNDGRLIAFLADQFANGSWGWAGHYPNVHIRRVFALKPVVDASVDQITLNTQGLTDVRTGAHPVPPETTAPGPGERQPIDWKNVGTAATVAAIGSALAAGTSYAITEFHTRRWKQWEPSEESSDKPRLPTSTAAPVEPPGASKS